MPYWPWKDATARLEMMVTRTRRGLADPKARFTYKLAEPLEPKMPFLTPARFRNVLVGPDGKPIQEV